MSRRESEANLLLIDIMDQISTYFNGKNKSAVKNTKRIEKTISKAGTKKKRRIKPAINPVLHKEKFAKCKYCGGNEFFWGETEWGWRLFDKDDNQHMCKDASEIKNGQLTTG